MAVSALNHHWKPNFTSQYHAVNWLVGRVLKNLFRMINLRQFGLKSLCSAVKTIIACKRNAIESNDFVEKIKPNIWEQLCNWWFISTVDIVHFNFFSTEQFCTNIQLICRIFYSLSLCLAFIRFTAPCIYSSRNSNLNPKTRNQSF